MDIKYRDLIRLISNRTGITQKDIKEIVDATFEEIIFQVSNKNTVNISKLGHFGYEVRTKRIIPHPKDNTKKIEVPEQNILKFYPSKVSKRIMKGEENI